MDLKEVKTKKKKQSRYSKGRETKQAWKCVRLWISCLPLSLRMRQKGPVPFLYSRHFSLLLWKKSSEHRCNLNGWRKTQKNSCIASGMPGGHHCAVVQEHPFLTAEALAHSSGPDGHSPLRKESSFLSVYPKFSKQPCLLGTQGTWAPCTVWCAFSILPITTNRSLTKWADGLFSGILLAQSPPIKSLLYH